MTEIRFYHLEHSGLESALPALIDKALSQNHKIIVKLPNDEKVEALNEHLWTFNPQSFIPHGSEKDAKPERQPVWLCANDDNPNKADVLILAQGAQSEKLKEFKLVCEMLNGHNPEEVTAARTRWKSYKDQGLEVTYWQQSPQGGWEKKA